MVPSGNLRLLAALLQDPPTLVVRFRYIVDAARLLDLALFF